MTFEELLDQAIAILERRGRVTYRALKRQLWGKARCDPGGYCIENDKRFLNKP